MNEQQNLRQGQAWHAQSGAELPDLQRKIAELEERLTFIMTLSGQVGCHLNDQGEYLVLERRWSGPHCIPAWRGAGDDMFSRAHPKDRDELRRAWFDAVKSGKALCHDCRMIMEDGTYRWWRSRAERIATNPTEAPRWQGLLTDIDVLQTKLEDVRAREARGRAAARTSRDAIWEFDLVKQTIVFDDMIRCRFGHDIGNTPVDMEEWLMHVHPDDRKIVRSALSNGLVWDQVFSEHRLRRADGEYAYVQIRGFVTRDTDGQPIHITGALSDLTEERTAKQRLEQLRAEILDDSRSNTAGALAAIFAHEINQPLTAMTNYVRGARRILHQGGIDKEAKLDEAIDAAATSALAAGAIVQRMRDLIGQGEGRLSQQALGSIVDDARSLVLLNDPPCNLRIDIEEEVREFEVIADRVQIHQVLMNLLRNAAEALAGIEEPRITLAAERSGEFVCVSIADNGPGFGTIEPGSVFAPFVTTKANGVGIGLSICRRIIEAGGGSIWAENNPNGGAIFRFTVLL